MSPLREMLQAVEEECLRHGCKGYTFDMSGKHAKVFLFGKDGLTRRMVSFSKTPSCKFAPHKVQRNVRHALKEIGYGS